jgi:tetratricopeptide (TPR) repeat protein
MSKIKQLQELLKENPDDTFLNYALALEHVKLNNNEIAAHIFDILIINESQYLATYLQYGNLLAQIGQNIKAENIYKRGIEVATLQNNLKAKQELEQALFLLD